MSRKNKQDDVDYGLNIIRFTEFEEKPSLFKRFSAFVGGILVLALITAAVVAPSGVAAVGATQFALTTWNDIEANVDDLNFSLPEQTVLLDKNGNKFAQFYTENRKSVKLDKISKYVKDGVVATEDARFYETHGFDLVGTLRAALSTSTGTLKSGGSGLVQQLTKNLLILNADTKEKLAAVQSRSIATKLQELKYAIQLDDKYSKDELLQAYLNTVFYGENSYGIYAASKTYFDTTPDKLTLSQSAYLSGVINSPTAYDLFKHPEAAKQRRDKVLSRMLVSGKITQAQHDAAVKEKLVAKRSVTKNGCGDSKYPYYCELVRHELLTNSAYGKTAQERQDALDKGGLTITTNLDPAAMKAAQDSVNAAWGTGNRVASAVAIIKPGTGDIVGIAQNRKYGTKKGQTQVVYANRERQLGSSAKPFTIATAYSQGIQVDKLVLNSNSFYKPRGYDSPANGFSNFGYYNYGNVTGNKATQMSLNVYFVKLMQKTGVLPVADMMNTLGLTVPTDAKSAKALGEDRVTARSLSLTLGAWGATPIQMSNAYSTFASGGILCNALTVDSAKVTETGEKVDVSDPDCHQAITPNVANNMAKILQNPFKEGGTLGDYKLSGSRQAAGKTGTSNSKGDAWAIATTMQYSTAVWSGDPRGASHPLTSYTEYGTYRAGGEFGTGGPVSGPIWKSIMNTIHKGLKNERFANPSNDVDAAIKGNTIPSVVGMDVNTAVTTLQSYGYTVSIDTKTDGDDRIAANTVVSQNPAGGGTGKHKEEVTLTLSQGSDTKVVISDPKKEN